MTIRERVEEMIAQGAVIQEPPTGVIEALGGVRWLDGPVLRWCGIHPVDQSGITHTPYHTARVVHGRDVEFLDKSGHMVAYITPVVESPLDTDYVREQLVEWRRLLGMPWNATHFEHFMDVA